MSKHVNPEFVSQELRYAKKIFNSQPDWPIINVTNKPIEEIAAEVLSIIRKKEKISV